jgi:ABC-type multidrug transport system ATPase subunit
MERPALDTVSFDVGPGAVVGLLGPNGAGKSTLVKVLCGVTAPDAGSVRILGADPVAHAAVVKQQLGVVHQSMPFDSMLSAIDNLKIAAAFRGLRWRVVRPRVEEMLAQFGIDGVVGKLAFTLSGGQRRRLQLVRALLVVPRLLILDEPSAGLDVEGRRQMWQMIGALSRDHGCTIIWTSHYIEEIERNCTRVLLIDDGVLLRDQDPASLVTELGGRSVQVRLPDAADRHRLLAALPSDSVTASGEQDLIINDDIADHYLATVVAAVRDAAPRGASIEFCAPSLEDVYVALVSRNRSRVR